MFNVVLVEPEIPPNTGNTGRLCLATDAHLHLIKPLGFSIDDRTLRRAGLDYWQHVRVSLWENWDDFCQRGKPPDARCFFFTTKTHRPYYDEAFREGDYLVFGRETKGLPESLLTGHPDSLLTIPMQPAARSLNLATAVAIVLFDAVRQVRTAR